jgi:hypothetical protein
MIEDNGVLHWQVWIQPPPLITVKFTVNDTLNSIIKKIDEYERLLNET